MNDKYPRQCRNRDPLEFLLPLIPTPGLINHSPLYMISKRLVNLHLRRMDAKERSSFLSLLITGSPKPWDKGCLSARQCMTDWQLGFCPGRKQSTPPGGRVAAQPPYLKTKRPEEQKEKKIINNSPFIFRGDLQWVDQFGLITLSIEGRKQNYSVDSAGEAGVENSLNNFQFLLYFLFLAYT